MSEKKFEKFTAYLLMSLLSGLSLMGAYFKYRPIGFFQIPWIELYFFCLLFLSTATLFLSSFFSIRSFSKQISSLDADKNSEAKSSVSKKINQIYFRYREIIHFSILFFVVFLFQAKDIHSTSIWLDEDYQIWTSLYQLPVYAGWQQHQPPLHFALLGGWLPSLGFSEISVRFFTLLFSALGVTYFAYFLRNISSSWYPILFVLPLYLFHPFIIRYSYEVRPVGIGLFCSIIWLRLCYSFERKETHSLWSILPLAATTFVTLAAFGFQGPALGLALAVGCLFGWSTKKNKLLSVSGLAFGLLAFFPIQWAILKNSPPRFQRLPNFSFVDFLSGYHWQTYKNFVALYLAPLIPFFLLLIGFGLLLIGWKKLLSEIWLRSRWPLLILGTTLVFIFPFFASYVDWPFQPYYYLFLWPILFICLTQLFPLVFPVKLLWIPSAMFFALFLSLIKIENPFFSSFIGFTEPRADLRSAIQKAVQVSQDGKESLLLPVCGGSGKDWCPNWIIGKDIYLSPRSLDNSKLQFPPMDTLAFYTQFFRHPVSLDRIIWLFQDDWSKYRVVPYLMKNEPEIQAVQYFGASLVFQNCEIGDARMYALEGLKKFERAAVEQGKDAFWIRAQITYGYLLIGNKSEAEFWLKRLPTNANSNDAKAWLEAIDREKAKLQI